MPKECKSSDENPGVAGEIAFYKKEGNAFQRQLDNLNSFLTNEQLKNLDEAELSARLKHAERLQANFENARSTLRRLDRKEFESDADENFSKVYIEVEAKINRWLNTKHKSSGAHSSTLRQFSWDDITPQQLQRRSRLPELKIPIFSGSYLDWPSFFSTFTSAIDKDVEMSKLEKMQYLITSLSDAALDTVRSLEPSEENYDKALDLLKVRFDNKLLHFQAHIKAIFGLQGMEMGASDGLRKLSDQVNAHLRALQTLATTEDIYNGLLIHLITSKLDRQTHEKWEENLSAHKLPTWTDMSTFLERRCRMMENLENAMVIQAPSKQVKNIVSQAKSKASVLVTVGGGKPTPLCIFCDSKEHFITGCTSFLNLSPNLRYKEAKKFHLCLNCLRKGHTIKQCKSGNCRYCQAKHNTLLHLNGKQDSVPKPIVASPVPNSQVTTSQSALTSLVASPKPLALKNVSNNCVLLATAIILVKNRAGTLIPCRAILDSASQLNFITSRLANQLQLRSHHSPVLVSGIGESSLNADRCVDIFAQAHDGRFSTSFTALITQSITDYQPNFDISIEGWNIPNNINLADPSFFKANRIDVLIGAELFYDLICVGQFRIADHLPTLQKTKLGWVVSGGVSHISNKLITLSAFRNLTPPHDSADTLSNIVKRFWEVENGFDSTPALSEEDAFCEQHFIQNFLRLPSGDYSVRLPPKSDLDALGESHYLALRRFRTLEIKLQKDESTKLLYSAFMQEYKDLGHMSLASFQADKPVYYLPHHCVKKQDSTTTKLRVVFDGSAKTTSGYSLNDLLLPGPIIQPKLFNILLRFRLFKVALLGDICKMYRCIKMSSPDDQLQCILWRDDPSEQIKTYKLNTVTYGTRPAAFLAIRAMHQLTFDEEESFPVGAKIIRRDFYVDDLISGGDSIEEVIQMKQEIRQLLLRGGFPIRKWCSNEVDVLKDEDESNCEKFIKFHDGTDVTKALGLVWERISDNFLFSFTPILNSQKITKRSILSVIARFYDPLGLICPVITKLKIFMQALWKEKLVWDESLPQSLQSIWLDLCGQLSFVSNLHFPRYVLALQARVQIHAFCDASLSAYGACVYTRVEKHGVNKIHLLCSKSRVAPLKSITVPKLELSAALLLAELVSNILENSQLSYECHCWSDSMVVLSWLRSAPSNFNIFVSNRVAKIQSLTSGMTWHHVPTELNPADILSRGCTPKELLNNTLWANGPSFLQFDSAHWPSNMDFLSNLPERRRHVLIAATQMDETYGCKFQNSFSKLQRVFAYVYKFRHIKSKRTLPSAGFLTVDDIKGGTLLLIRHIQQVHFASEYKILKENKQLPSCNHLLSLNPFIDDFGSLRVGGRLYNSNLEFEAKHPLLLPKQHPVTSALIKFYHRKLLHAGPQSLLASIRQQFWPIGGRKTVSKIINKCLRCFRLKPRVLQQIMGQLPTDRVRPSRPFITTGVDYCGPLQYKCEVRNRPPVKCYVCIFVCFSTKACHLELVQDLSTSSFIAALKRFISIRGKPNTIWSDNATNFVGAKNELEELRKLFADQNHNRAVAEACIENQIDWKFIPPRSPHFGGLWEAAVKSAKLHFYRTVGVSILTFDELRTLICEISAILNSRPLCPITENPDDLDVLTPAHFLIGGSFTAIEEPIVTHLNMNRLSRWQRICQMQQIFWQRWSTAYLSLLQERCKWRNPMANIQQGAMVLLKDDNQPPLKWSLGRVEHTFSGADGYVRAAIIKTANGPVKRAITKIAALPVETDLVESLHLPTGGVCMQQESA
ncbi:uncharacterized protein LOC128870048 [Anastrepha ludens]|uniref:uncharacterized protein LOC128870048 n=1 Tax=Anastrepha ludens TaxID=28586 RepID=UPI0023AE6C6B|nr:uncharacterized protein LOC128870048 [Anastrepha ludens]